MHRLSRSLLLPVRLTKAISTMPKDSKASTKGKAKGAQPPLRPMRTMSTVALALGALDVSVADATIAVGAATEDKQEGSSKSPLESPADAITLEFLERNTMGPSWFEALKLEFEKPYFLKLKKFIAAETAAHTIYPSIGNIYSWSRLTPLDSVRVVVLGQDPYHDVGQAHGLSFSVLPPTKPPASLKNIYKQLQTDYPNFVPPKSGDLTPLASAGVLFLNTSLTVRAHAPSSHAKRGWESLTSAALRCVTSRPAEQGVKVLAGLNVDETKHLVLRSAHPSPLSAYRGFLGNGHFRLANEWLEQKYGAEGCIDWEVLSKK
ncbi:uracil DNA N-glycosylase Ung1 [Mycena filopes]|nr:uracil DNA N-glycosylase Ung1 [Mycena filopes]